MYVIGTAGHIDHGKSALIQKLTGIDPDRLQEEKERGMTIDLGFAWLKLPNGNEVGIIDVPGHERFIKNMLAGVGAIDLALLVIAANESVMPQTREHLDILNLLGIKRGVVAITKKDLVNDELLDLVKMEAEEVIKDTFLKDAPIMPVSAVTGEGIADLIGTIEDSLKDIAPKRDRGKPRLFIDRIFSISGAGTVVTGTLIEGQLMAGEEVQISPTGLKARIRGLQTHKKQLQKASPGSRVAVNLAGIAAAQLQRGNVITRPGWMKPTNRIDVRLTLLPNIKNNLLHGSVVSFFTGSSEELAKLHLPDRERVESGEKVIAQFSFSSPVSVVKGDHFIIRSPMDTLGGGVIIYPHAVRHRRYRKEIIQNLQRLEGGTTGEIIVAFLELNQPTRFKDLVMECNLMLEEAQEALESLISRGTVITVGKGDSMVLFTGTGWSDVTRRALDIVNSYHKKYPARTGISKSELTSKLRLDSNSPFLKKLYEDKMLVEEGATVRLPAHKIEFSAEQLSVINAYLTQLEKNPYSPQADTGLNADILNRLVEQQKIVKVGDGVIFSKQAYDEMVNRIVNYARKNGKVTLAEVRDMFNTSRKFAKALLEYMDEKKITKRVGDERIVR
jgi:selenocysteine-specific elongation factor